MSQLEKTDNSTELLNESRENSEIRKDTEAELILLQTNVELDNAMPDLTDQINSERIEKNETSGNKSNNFGNMHKSETGNTIGFYKTKTGETLNVYPTRVDGLKATKQLLKNKYFGLTLERVAKKRIGTDNPTLAKTIMNEEDLNISDSLSDNNIDKFLIALGRREGNLKKGQTLDQRLKEGKIYSLNTNETINISTIETPAAPIETPAAPVETPAAPVEATAAPVEATAAPVEATAATNTAETPEQKILSMKSQVNNLLEAYKALKKKIHSTEGSAKTKTEFKHQLNENIQNLKNIQADLNNYSYQADLTKYEARIGELEFRFKHYEQVRQMIVLGDRTSNIHTIIDSKSDAQHAEKHAEKQAKYNQELNAILHETAITSLWNDDMESYEDYLKLVINGQIEPSSHPFYTKHQKSLLLIKSTNPDLYSLLVPAGNSVQTKEQIQISMPQSTEHTKKTAIDYSNSDRGESFEKGGLSGLIGKALSCCNNMTPGQRNTRQTLLTLGMIGGLIYGGYKFFTSKRSFRKKAGRTAAAFLIPEIAVGENPISFINKLLHGGLSFDELGDKVGNIFGEIGNSSNPEVATTAIPLILPTIFGSEVKVSDITQMSQNFKDYPEAWSEFYRATYQKIQGDDLKNYRKSHFDETFDEYKRNEFLSNAGINEYSDGKWTVHELAETANKNDIIINQFECKYGLKVTKDNNLAKEYKAFVKMKKGKNELITEGELEQGRKEKLWFEENEDLTHTEREEDKQNIEKLTTKVDGLHISDEETKNKLIIALKEFYDNKPIKNKPLVDTITLSYDDDTNILTFTSNQNETGTEIDIANVGIKGFTESNTVRFKNLAEAISVAHLTNHILGSTYGSMPVDINSIFAHHPTGKGIYFNDSKVWERNSDTRVLSTGVGGASAEFSAIHDENLGEYAKYLSNRRKEIHKIKLDAAIYPILSKIGIEFYNEEEAKGLESLLKTIVEELETSSGTAEGQPFSIDGNALYFKHLDNNKYNFGSIEQFISIKHDPYKSKFLQYINNPNNKIFGRSLS